MNAIKFATTVDEAVAGALPRLRPMLGRRVEVIALEAEEASPHTTTLDEFLDHRLKRPAGAEPVTLQDMEAAITQGALGEDL